MLTRTLGLTPDIEVDETDSSDTRRGEIHRCRTAEPSRTDDEHRCPFELALSLKADLWDQQVAAVAADFLVREN